MTHNLKTATGQTVHRNLNEKPACGAKLRRNRNATGWLLTDDDATCAACGEVELAPGTTVRILAARDGQDAAVVGELGTVCESPAGSEPLVLVGAHAPQWYRREDLAIVAEVERVAAVETDEQWEARQAEIARRESRLTFLADELPSTSYEVTVTVTVPGVATHSPEDAARFVREMIEETLGEHRPTFKAASVAAESEVA